MERALASKVVVKVALSVRVGSRSNHAPDLDGLGVPASRKHSRGYGYYPGYLSSLYTDYAQPIKLVCERLVQAMTDGLPAEEGK